MPKMPLSPENKARSSFDFPKLFLEKGERARIVLFDPEPQTEYVHTMRGPQLVNGEPQYDVDPKTGAKVMRYDFIGRHICLGSFDVIADKGMDAKACPVCAESKSSDMVKPPERRHALNIIRYKTQPGSFTIHDGEPESGNPFTVEVLVWAFGDGQHSKLIEKAEEWGDLREHDLLLGPCEVKSFQRFDIAVAKEAMWMSTPKRAVQTKEVFKANHIGDLSIACGRRLSREIILEDLAKVQDRHAMAFGTSVSHTPTMDEIDVSGVLGGVDGVTQSAGEPPFSPPAPAPAHAGGGAMSLDEILNM